jgi:two-component system chemotaxis response regulator CheB
MKTVAVLIVDDSAFVRRAVERMLTGAPDIRVVGTASNGVEAVARVKELSPDVVVLDVNMPHLDGLEALRRIMAEAPTGVLMLSTLTSEGAETTLLALELGAVDFIDKTLAGGAMNIYSLTPVHREMLLAVAGASIPRAPPAATPDEETPDFPVEVGSSPFELLVIGASTGGPRALTEVLRRLPAHFPLGIVVAQHMPAGFTATLAERLDQRSSLSVIEAEDRTEVRPGHVLIAPGGRQITLERRFDQLVVRVDDGPSNLLYRPSVDVLFESAAELVGNRTIGCILTGMGDDGARGLKVLHDRGARTVAESEESAVIYGMPRAAATAADQIVPLHEIGPVLTRIAYGPVADAERVT